MTTTTFDQNYPHVTYPVTVTVDSVAEGHNRLTTFFRPILSIPHMILVGPGGWIHRLGSAGLLGAAAYLLAIVNWFAILINAEPLKGVHDFQLYYLRWRTRALAYMGLFVDVYPPFGDAPYPAEVVLKEPSGARDRVSIALRPILAVPHLILLCFLIFGWALSTFVAWLVILFTGAFPPALHGFGLGVMRWLIRVEAYLLLLVDEYPPFTLE